MGDTGTWTNELAAVVDDQTETCLAVYREDAARILQDANNERRIAGGGYQTRQLEELMQNAVDVDGCTRIDVVLTKDTLYVANNGAPFGEKGIRSVMASDVSTKDDTSIGRFGIGFKSVLAISDRPRILSRTASVEFDAGWAEQFLRKRGYKSPAYPTMRLARVLHSPEASRSNDPQLDELMAWASTVIVLPLSTSFKPIAQRLHEFPAEFALFAPHLDVVHLRNLTGQQLTGAARSTPTERTITRSLHGDIVDLLSNSTTTSWIVTRRTHRPSERALADGGHAAARKSVDIQYALPLSGGDRLGRFWAYFRTDFQTTLTGLINAPWKLSDDRKNLLPGDFNKELLDQLPGLVAETFGKLPADNPVAALDAMPARGKEPRNWADDFINEPIFDELRRSPCAPDGTGRLRVPREIKWVGAVDADWLETWAQSHGAPRGEWLHREAYANPERLSKVARLIQADGSEAGNPPRKSSEWLEALVTTRTVESSADAIELAALITADARSSRDSRRSVFAADVPKARIIRLEDGSFRAPTRGEVFVRIDGADDQPDVDFVDPQLAARPDIREALAQLGIVVMDRGGELRRLLAQAGSRPTGNPAQTWVRIWTLLRTMPMDAAAGILREDLPEPLERSVLARTAAGQWKPLCEMYLTGRIIPDVRQGDAEVLIDPRFHAQDEEMLRKLGAVSGPAPGQGRVTEPWFAEYRSDVTMRVLENMPDSGSSATADDLEVIPSEHSSPPMFPLEPIRSLNRRSVVAATASITNRPRPEPWVVKAQSKVRFNPKNVTAPEVWFLRRYGLVNTSFGPLPPHRTLRHSEGIDPNVLPVSELSEAWADALCVNSSEDGLDWETLKASADKWDDDERRTAFYTWLPGRLDPSGLVVRVGQRLQSVGTEHIGVTSNEAVYDSMREAQIPALLVPDADDLERLVDTWGMPRGEDLLREEIIIEASGEPTYLTDTFPPLKGLLTPEQHDLKFQVAHRLEKMTATPRGQVARKISERLDGSTVVITAVEPRDQLMQVSRALRLGLGASDIDLVLQSMRAAASSKLRTEIKHAADNDDRLLIAVGEDELRKYVPKAALAVLDRGAGGRAGARDVAALARAAHGIAILKQLRPVLEERELDPPREWGGRRIERNWVTSLGFPVEWAGFPSTRRATVETIDGPAQLQPLHDYQQTVTDNIHALVRGDGPQRGMVSLPTGSGKTRVTVEALVNAVREGDVPTTAPIIWIAQTEELCEQAADAWSYVWRAVGSPAPLRLCRLWSSDQVDEEPGTFQLVIATIDKLDSIRKREGEKYEWLCDASVVVIDEAHTSIAPSYTQVLRWLGRTAARDEDNRRPLIGLTATPFRGTSEEQTTRLVNRYDGNRLDRGAFDDHEDPYPELQRQGVLANVKQEILEGVTVDFTDAEIADIDTMRRIPAAVTDRLGEDLGRTSRVVESITGLPSDWPVIVFAPSVESARTLAALLSHRGIPAVSISADTERSARRFYIEKFKKGRIRVLTNYNVLSQGFDAPKVRAVYVARPTFTPNVYQQMIGRGLRGPKNGGSEEVLIVNVEDNFRQYGDLLAFRQFEYLWSRNDG